MLFKKPNGSPILHITPRNIQVNPMPCGSLHLRHSTSSSDLQAMDKILCGPYDGVFVATFVCAGAKTPSCDMVRGYKHMIGQSGYWRTLHPQVLTHVIQIQKNRSKFLLLKIRYLNYVHVPELSTSI